jgi:hypothetical protein
VRRKDVLGMTLDALDVAAHAAPRGERAGALYVLTNDAMPGLVKVGRSNNVARRRHELSSATGVPLNFRVAASLIVPDAVAAERAAHAALAPHRLNDNREFFCVTPARAVEHISRALSREPSEWRTAP